jgi:hypothetical protein
MISHGLELSVLPFFLGDYIVQKDMAIVWLVQLLSLLHFF